MNAQQNRIIMTSGILLALAVGLGAFGAHALEGRISSIDLGLYKTANQYHFIHAIGMLILASFTKKIHSKTILWACIFLFSGIFFFSGSLYLLALSEALFGNRLSILGLITPIGGVSFIIGWLVPAYSVRSKIGKEIKSTKP